jgi:hypothetical protein
MHGSNWQTCSWGFPDAIPFRTNRRIDTLVRNDVNFQPLSVFSRAQRSTLYYNGNFFECDFGQNPSLKSESSHLISSQWRNSM